MKLESRLTLDELQALGNMIINKETDKALGFILAKKMDCAYFLVLVTYKPAKKK